MECLLESFVGQKRGEKKTKKKNTNLIILLKLTNKLCRLFEIDESYFRLEIL